MKIKNVIYAVISYTNTLLLIFSAVHLNVSGVSHHDLVYLESLSGSVFRLFSDSTQSVHLALN